MKKTFDHTAAIKILRDGIAKGYWTLEQLDNPPPGTQLAFDEWQRHPMCKNLKTEPPRYHNLLRDAEDKVEDDFIL